MKTYVLSFVVLLLGGFTSASGRYIDSDPHGEATSTTRHGLETKDWQLHQYIGASGDMVPVLPETIVDARFSNGNISGGAGCNRFTAAYEIKGRQISVGHVMTTRKYCAEADGVMQQEQQYLQALARARAYTLGPDRLELRDQNGTLQVRYRVSVADSASMPDDQTAMELGRRVLGVKQAIQNPSEPEAMTAITDLGRDHNYYAMVRGWLSCQLDGDRSILDASKGQVSDEVKERIRFLEKAIRAINLE